MSDAEDPSLPKKALRTVTPGTRGHKNTGMDVIGWSVFVGMLVLLVPLLPFILIVWLITKVLDRLSGE